MRHLSLSATVREKGGRCVCKRLRASGRVPAVIYGHSGTRSLEIDEKEFSVLLAQKGHSAALVEVKVGKDKGLLSDISDIQKDPITGKVLHVDFHEVVQTEKMMTTIPLEFVGEPIGVKNSGGVLDIARREISIRCLPADLPSGIQVDVSGLDVGNILHLSDLKLPAGVEIVGDTGIPVVSCKNVAEEELPSASEEAVASAAAPTEAAAGS